MEAAAGGEDERDAANQIVAGTEAELAAPKPRKPVIAALLKALPVVGDIASIAGAILALVK